MSDNIDPRSTSSARAPRPVPRAPTTAPTSPGEQSAGDAAAPAPATGPHEAPPRAPLLLNAADAAALLGLGRSTFLAYDVRGLVPQPVRLGRMRRWPEAELRAWVAAGCPPRSRWQGAAS